MSEHDFCQLGGTRLCTLLIAGALISVNGKSRSPDYSNYGGFISTAAWAVYGGEMTPRFARVLSALILVLEVYFKRTGTFC